MSALGKKVRITTRGPMIMCPACKHGHLFNQKGLVPDGAPSWEFNGDGDKPTFSPSMLVFTPDHTDSEGVHHERMTICHSFVRDGKIEFLSDCRHDMAGTTVDLPDFPGQDQYHTQ